MWVHGIATVGLNSPLLVQASFALAQRLQEMCSKIDSERFAREVLDPLHDARAPKAFRVRQGLLEPLVQSCVGAFTIPFCLLDIFHVSTDPVCRVNLVMLCLDC